MGSWPALDSLPWPEDAPPLLKALVAGSWVPRQPEGFDQAWIDEAGLVQAYTRRRAGRRQWHGFRSASPRLDIDRLITDRTGPAVAYVFGLVMRNVPDPLAEGALAPLSAVLHVRHAGRLRLWFDGQQVLDLPAPDPGVWGVARARIRLTDAFDILLLKLGRGTPELGDSMNVELRITAPDGSPIPFQTFNTMRPSHLPPDVDPELLR